MRRAPVIQWMVIAFGLLLGASAAWDDDSGDGVAAVGVAHGAPAEPEPQLQEARLEQIPDHVRRSADRLVRITVQRVDRPTLDAVQVSGLLWTEGDERYAVTLGAALFGADRVIVDTADLTDARRRTQRAEIVGIDADAGIGVLRLEGESKTVSRLGNDQSWREMALRAAVPQAVPDDGSPPESDPRAATIPEEGEPPRTVYLAGLEGPSGTLAVSRAVWTGIVGRQETKDSIRRPLLTLEPEAGDRPPLAPGGVVLDESGEPLGLLLCAASGRSFGEGVRVAVPVERVDESARQLLCTLDCGLTELPNESRPVRPWIGIRAQDVSEALRSHLDLTVGATVIGVCEGSPAEAAGLECHDVIIAFDGHSVIDLLALKELVESSRAGEEVELLVVHQGQRVLRTLVLGAW